MRIGIFLPNWIGDTAMCTPMLRALRRHFADGELVGVLSPYVAEVLAGTPWLDDRILYRRRSHDARERPWAVARELRRRNFDTLVICTNSFRSALMARYSGARQRVGFARYGRAPLLTHKLYYPRRGWKRLPTPAIDSYLQLAYAVGCRYESPRLELATLPADEDAADRVWRKYHLLGGNRVVVMHSGGAYGVAKLWPPEHFAALARRLATQHDLAVLLTCGPDDRDVARRTVALANHPRVVSLADDEISVGLIKACIRRSRVMVSTDTGPRFFAVAFGVPLVTLFGPTDQGWSRSHDPQEICLQHQVPCGPCARRVCPLGHHDCMRLLSVERVYAAACAQLERRPISTAA